MYIDNPALKKIGVVRVEKAAGSPGKVLTEVQLQFNFGHSEVTVVARDPVTRKASKEKISIEFTT